jgi:pyocin large subunit-like protein
MLPRLPRRLLLMIAVLVAIIGVALNPTDGTQVIHLPTSWVKVHVPEASASGTSIGFANTQRLDEHYAKHGAEFGNISKQDYLRQAQALRDAPAGGPILEVVRGDGVRTRFDRRTGAFLAFNANGVIRTFFRPNDGERYFRRQAERD